MTSLLWVEDFEEKEYRQTTYDVFGRVLNLSPDDIPKEEYLLREFLVGKHIRLATSYAEAARIINVEQDGFDAVVLDIDLDVLGDDIDEDLPWVEPVLARWHGYSPESEDREASYNSARAKMKIVAGYHLFIDLALNNGFPRSRILFCSNHGDNLESVNKSFEPAMIERPQIYQKRASEVANWLTAVFDDQYLCLRRGIINACREIGQRIVFGQSKFKLAELPGVERGQVTTKDGKDWIETLPHLLPVQFGKNETRDRIAYRLFVRTLTQDWDKVSLRDKTFKFPDKAFAAVLVSARNWTSHDGKALSCLTPPMVAFLFLISLRASFDGLSRIELEDFEDQLLRLLGEPHEFSLDELAKDLDRTAQEIHSKWEQLPQDRYDTRFFKNKANALAQAGRVRPGEHEKLLLQIFWHQLGSTFGTENRLQKDAFLQSLCNRIFRHAF